MSKKMRCHVCNRVLGILKKDLLEIKCPRCGAYHVYNPKTKTLALVKKKK